MTTQASAASDCVMREAINTINDVIQKSIPIAAAMGARVISLNDSQIMLEAPFDPNRNDKGTAFAGSIFSVLALAGWSLVTAVCMKRGLAADVMIADSNIRFLKPATGALKAVGGFCGAPDWSEIQERLASGRAAKVAVNCSLLSADATEMATMKAQYAIRLAKETIGLVGRV